MPSPPSAIGSLTTSVDGSADNAASATMSQTCAAERVPLNESGAITIFMMNLHLKSSYHEGEAGAIGNRPMEHTMRL